MRIAVTGGAGFIGRHVVDLLLGKGHEVSCLILPTEGSAWATHPGLTIHRGSILDPASLPAFLEGAEVVIHLAGLTRAKTEEEFVSVNAEGARNIFEAAIALPKPPSQVIAMSSLAALGPSAPDGTGITEDAEFRPVSPYGRSKVALERVAEEYKGRIACTFIRAPCVYGPRDRDFLQYFRLVNKGLRVIIGPRNVVSLVYVKNLALAIESCMLNPAAYGHAFFVADEGTYDWDQISELIEAYLGKKTFRLRIPTWVVHVAAFFTTAFKPFFRKPPLLTKDKLVEMRQPCWIVSTEKARTLLGYKPSYETKSAFAETGAWYQAEGWI